jgi:hypothetical protein
MIFLPLKGCMPSPNGKFGDFLKAYPVSLSKREMRI